MRFDITGDAAASLEGDPCLFVLEIQKASSRNIYYSPTRLSCWYRYTQPLSVNESLLIAINLSKL